MKVPVEKTSASKLLDPLFLLALGLLLLNDHWWKGAWHNFFTGKLSDFAGLYAFAWVGMCLCGRRLGNLRSVHAVLLGSIGLGFALWKSPWSDPLLAGWNALDLLPLQRVVDYGDWAAIAVLPLASRRYLRGERFSWAMLGSMQATKNVHFGAQMSVLCLSIFAFCATSSRNEFIFDKHYDIPAPPLVVMHRLDSLSVAGELPNPTLSMHYYNAHHLGSAQGNPEFKQGSTQSAHKYGDSIFERQGDSLVFQGINLDSNPEADTMIVNAKGMFQYTFPLRNKKTGGENTRQCETVEATLQLVPRGTGSQLSLLRIYIFNCEVLPPNQDSESAENYIRRRFEEEVVNPLLHVRFENP